MLTAINKHVNSHLLSFRQRNALFSMPVGLTVGDDSTNYQTFRRERHEVG